MLDDTGHEPLPEDKSINVSCAGTQDTSQGSVHIVKTSAHLAQRSFKLPGGGPEKQDACPKDPGLKLTDKGCFFSWK